MKKLLALLLAAAMVLSMAACSNGTDGEESNADAPQITDALEILTTVWGTYAEEEKFPVGGGDSANTNWEGAGKFDVAAVEELDANFAVNADMAAQIDDAASMMNAMMINNFCAGAFHLADAANMDSFTSTLKDNILAKEWMCGMPEKAIIVTIGDYVVSAYGLVDFIDTFQEKLTTEYPAAKVVCEENLI